MFGIGAQEMVMIGVIGLVVFGPGKLPQMARDLGGFVAQARTLIDEYKAELNLTEDSDLEEHYEDWEEEWDEDSEASWDESLDEEVEPDDTEEVVDEESDGSLEAPIVEHEHLAEEVS